VAGAAGILKLDDALGVFDLRADRNSSYSYRERTYPRADWVAGDGAVIEHARLWMPADATYRVVIGPHFDRLGYSKFAPYFILGRLLPRRQTKSAEAPWVFCYGCDRSTLGKRFELLKGNHPALVFGRIAS
jgi:hypothetical protein